MAALAAFLALGTIANGTFVFTELTSAGGYARQPITMASAGNGTIVNQDDVSFPVVITAQWPLYNAFAIFDAASDGKLLMCWGVSPPLPNDLQVGKHIVVARGSIQLELPVITSNHGSEVLIAGQSSPNNYAESIVTGLVLNIGVRKNVALGICGQSVESNVVVDPETPTTLLAYESRRNAAVCSPQAGNITLADQNPYYKRRGGFWFSVYDQLWDHGYNLQMFNGAIGSMSMITHACGFVSAWAANKAFCCYREPAGHGDRGDWGDMTVQGGKLFRCKVGRRRFAFSEAPNRMGTLGVGGIDYISTGLDTNQSGAAAPNWASAVNVGDTVADGTVVWEVIDATNSLGYANGTILNQRKRGFGFDPLGILTRIAEEMKRMRTHCDDSYIILQNGQSDAGQSANNYRDALTYVANYYLSQGFKVIVGLSCYTPTKTVTEYNNLSTGVDAAVTSLKTAFGATKVFAGAKLYPAMGTALTGLLQADNVHLNAAGVLVGADYISSALKTILPKK